MVQSPSWAANWFAASQEFPHISQNPKVHYRTHKRPPPVSILCQPNPVHIPTSHLLDIHPNIIHPSTPRSSQWSLSLRFPHQDPIHPPVLTHMCHMPSPSHSSWFFTRTILGEEYRSLSSSLCSLLQSPITLSLLGLNILLNTMFSNTLGFLSSHNVNDQVSHPYKTNGKIIFLYILTRFEECWAIYICIRKGHSHLKHNSLTSTIPWLTPTHAVSPSHTHPWPPCGLLPSTACFCTRTRPYPVTFLPIGQTIFKPNLFPYKYPNISETSSFFTPMKMEQTECSETSAYKIQMPGNYPEESIQRYWSCLRTCRSRHRLHHDVPLVIGIWHPQIYKWHLLWNEINCSEWNVLMFLQETSLH